MMKSVAILLYWTVRKLLFDAFVRDDKLLSKEFIWYGIRDSRNTKLIIESVRVAEDKDLKEVVIELYHFSPITISWS